MDGAKATIASSVDRPAYTVDDEAGGMKMTNHEWVGEREIPPASCVGLADPGGPAPDGQDPNEGKAER